MSRKLSYSAVSTYNTCGRKYQLHYLEGYREKVQRSSLLFGSAFDSAANELLLTRDLDKALAVFEKNWHFGFVNKVYTDLSSNPDIVFSEKDLDFDLLDRTEETKEWVKAFLERKKSMKWLEIPKEERTAYNELCWASLLAKGKIMLTSYYKKVLPQFVKVEGVQEKCEVTNADGDTLIQYLDFVAHFQDGSIAIMDNKTTSSLQYYADDSPGKSTQLLSYFAMNKEKFNLEAVGYVAISKEIIKNKTKTCSKCKVDGTSSKARTCDQEYPGKVLKRGKEVDGVVRCDGEWNITLGELEAAIKVIVNPVKEAAMNLAIESLDVANQGIKAGIWYRNLSVCSNQFGSPCPFYQICWNGDYSEVSKKEES